MLGISELVVKSGVLVICSLFVVGRGVGVTDPGGVLSFCTVVSVSSSLSVIAVGTGIGVANPGPDAERESDDVLMGVFKVVDVGDSESGVKVRPDAVLSEMVIVLNVTNSGFRAEVPFAGDPVDAEEVGTGGASVKAGCELLMPSDDAVCNRSGLSSGALCVDNVSCGPSGTEAVSVCSLVINEEAADD